MGGTFTIPLIIFCYYSLFTIPLKQTLIFSNLSLDSSIEFQIERLVKLLAKLHNPQLGPLTILLTYGNLNSRPASAIV